MHVQSVKPTHKIYIGTVSTIIWETVRYKNVCANCFAKIFDANILHRKTFYTVILAEADEKLEEVSASEAITMLILTRRSTTLNGTCTDPRSNTQTFLGHNKNWRMINSSIKKCAQ